MIVAADVFGKVRVHSFTTEVLGLRGDAKFRFHLVMHSRYQKEEPFIEQSSEAVFLLQSRHAVDSSSTSLWRHRYEVTVPDHGYWHCKCGSTTLNGMRMFKIFTNLGEMPGFLAIGKSDDSLASVISWVGPLVPFPEDPKTEEPKVRFDRDPL